MKTKSKYFTSVYENVNEAMKDIEDVLKTTKDVQIIVIESKEICKKLKDLNINFVSAENNFNKIFSLVNKDRTDLLIVISKENYEKNKQIYDKDVPALNMLIKQD